MSLSAAKKAKTKAEKVFKKKPDASAGELLEKANAALVAKNLDEAIELFNKVQEICQNSSVEAVAKKKNRPPKEEKSNNQKKDDKGGKKKEDAKNKEEDVVDESAKLLPPGQLCPKGSPEDKPNYSLNTPELVEEFKKNAPSTLWRTRFPPEPNGYLHIGHGKAMNFNFSLARANKGECYLRFDDTNPTAEKQEYIDSILRSVEWLGNKPAKVTYSSDYFQELYDFAVQLIKQGDAYVCNQTQPEVKASRDALKKFHSTKTKDSTIADIPAECKSPCRDRCKEENLRMFELMRIGYFVEGEVCLRMKGDLLSDIPSQWDMAAYRIMYHEHPHSKRTWCIYPTYDYTHCIVDSLEYVSHSLCTTEFATRQAPDGSYYWLLDALKLYRPVTWEYSRCNIAYNVLSKRKLNQLVTDGHVRGWNDPRLLTLDGLRRRGYTAQSINKFCHDIGVTKSEGTIIPNEKLEFCIRSELENTAPRAFAVLRPLKVVLTNFPSGKSESLTVLNHPKDESLGTRTMTISRELYMERTDFRETDEKGYFGLAPGKCVRLLQAYNITCDSFKKGADGEVCEVHCTYDPDKDAKVPKGKVHWVDASTSIGCELRLYNRLFDVLDPNKKSDDGCSWLDHVNPESEVVLEGCKVERAVLDSCGKPGTAFQFQRAGYFTVDIDSTNKTPVFNRTVGLKESREKRTM